MQDEHDGSVAVLRRWAAVIDAHDWAGLPALLHPSFRCELVHTGEVFDGPSWVRFNAEYPGFQSFSLEDAVGAEDRAVGRGHVIGLVDGVEQHYAVASFLTIADGLITELVEVWADLEQAPPPGTRLGP